LSGTDFVTAARQTLLEGTVFKGQICAKYSSMEEFLKWINQRHTQKISSYPVMQMHEVA